MGMLISQQTPTRYPKARVQLDPTLDLDTLGLTPAEKTIAKALQDYGMFLVDYGATGVSIEAINPASVTGNPYDGLLPDVDFPNVGNIPLDKLRVLEMGPQNPNADDENELVASGCGSMDGVPIAGEGEGEDDDDGIFQCFGGTLTPPNPGNAGRFPGDMVLLVLAAVVLIVAANRKRLAASADYNPPY